MKIEVFTKAVLVLLVLLASLATINAQEVLTNAQIIEMSKAGLGNQLIISKINSTAGNYDASANALVMLKNAGVENAVIFALLAVSNKTDKQNFNITEQTTPKPIVKPDAVKTSARLLREAHTIILAKHSLFPSLSDLESSVLKRPGWAPFNLSIIRNRSEADLIVEINHEFLTHYNFRVVDAKTGKVLTASGVTSLGGALAGNVAEKLIKRLNEVLANN